MPRKVNHNDMMMAMGVSNEMMAEVVVTFYGGIIPHDDDGNTAFQEKWQG